MEAYMTQNNKFNLDDNIKIGKCFLENSQFNIPTQLFIDFTSARPNYYDESGNRQEDVQKYTLNGVDVTTGQALVKAGVDLSKFDGVQIEVLNNLDIVENLIDQKFIGAVKFIDPKVKPLWVARGNSGAFTKVKLVVDGIEATKK